jgi:hypothetical protein
MNDIYSKILMNKETFLTECWRSGVISFLPSEAILTDCNSAKILKTCIQKGINIVAKALFYTGS